MAGQSKRWGFLKLDDYDDYLEMNGRRFVWSDRDLLDRILTYAENHVHDDRSPVEEAPAPPTVQVSDDVGMIPAGTTVYYVAARVDDRGQQHRASNLAVAHTQPQIPAPAVPAVAKTTGTLPAGEYRYAISAYTGISKAETTISQEAVLILTTPGGVTLTMPNPPPGADGFNIYRQGPLDRGLRYVTNVLIDTPWTDDGSQAADQNHRPSATNRTHSYNAFEVFISDTDLPTGESWDLYRTYDPSNWQDSFVDRSTDNSIIDYGVDTTDGAPPVASGLVGSPGKIRLGDAEQVDGRLPSGLLIFTDTVNFTVDEPMVGALEWCWLCEYSTAEILSVRCTLGRDAYPAAEDIEVSIERSTDGGVTWVDVLFGDDGPLLVSDSPIVAVGEFIGPLAVVQHHTFWSGAGDPVPDYWPHFELGDRMRLKITQDGGGATPMDYALTVNVLLACTYGSEDFTYEMGAGINLNNILLDEDGNPLLDEDGNFLLWG